MKKYDNYKDSGIEWIGEIPEHWKLKKIKHTTYVKGRIGWQGLRSDEFLEEAESLVVTGTDFIDGKINWETCYQIPIERYNEDINIQLKENDLLITKDGTIGKVSLVKNMPKIATLNSGVFLTRPSTKDYITEYMYWVLVSDVFKTFYDFNKSGSTIQHLYQYVFNEFCFTKPSLEEQTFIANYLDHKTTQIDTLITKKQQFISLLQEERIAVINQAVTKGLDPKVKKKDSGIEWLGEIPEHWEVKRMKYCFQIFGGFAFSSSEFTTEGVQIVKIGNL
jgi:type I restriction enzyme S subunit